MGLSVGLSAYANFSKNEDIGGYYGAGAFTFIDGSVYLTLNSLGPIGAVAAIGYSYGGGSAGLYRTVRYDVMPAFERNIDDLKQQMRSNNREGHSFFQSLAFPNVFCSPLGNQRFNQHRMAVV